MNELIGLFPALLAGAVLGILFFGGLWLTVQKGLGAKKSALLFTGSFIIRMAIVLLGFYFVGTDNWQRMLVCLLGFILARMAVMRFVQRNKLSKTVLIKEVSNET